MRDVDVRNALRRKVLAHHYADLNTLVIDELGISHGASRVDIAVVNGKLHGFEIKSASDTLERLAGQIEAYSKVFDRMTIVCALCHYAKVAEIVPSWWGIKVAKSGGRGAVHFEEPRAPRANPAVDAVSVARLLWRDEALTLLESRGVKGIKSKNRDALYSLLATSVALDELCAAVRSALKSRERWRSDAIRTQGADWSPPDATS